MARAVGSVFNRGVRRNAALRTNLPIGMRDTASSRMAAKKASDQVVGRRILTGGALLGGVGIMRNRDGSRGGYKGPRGSGRYA